MSEALRFGPPVISIDVEDWPQSTWDRSLPITERAARSTRRVLEILRQSAVRTTMFVLGKFAQAFPEVVREIHADGHEVASHGYGHEEIFRQSPAQFRDDIWRSKDLLQQMIGHPVKGYRAPDFSVVHDTLWALPILAEVGFEYDSSIYPIQGMRYGIPYWPTHPVRVRLANDRSIIEAPIATLTRFRKRWPVGGGGYHRLLPGVMSRFCAREVMKAAPFVLYCHPYEFDPREFRSLLPLLHIPAHVRLHQGLGRRWYEHRFRRFLNQFGGQPAAGLLSSTQWPEFCLDTVAGRCGPVGRYGSDSLSRI
jgi:polysaccharide deacetylase family protein (PEP-CTERM system associated)